MFFYSLFLIAFWRHIECTEPIKKLSADSREFLLFTRGFYIGIRRDVAINDPIDIFKRFNIFSY